MLRMTPKRLLPKSLRRLGQRVPCGVPSAKVRSFTRFGWQYARGRGGAQSVESITANWLWGGRRFCELVLQSGLEEADAVYMFNSAALEVLIEARKQGKLTVLDQTIAPRQLERKLMEVERDKFPGWDLTDSSDPDDPFLDEYCERERREWAEADLILCGSGFVRDGVDACGGPSNRCSIVPYGVVSSFSIPPRIHDGLLRVLVVGAVGLRKGGPYVLEAATQLKDSTKFRWAGPLQVTASVESDLRRHISMVGVVPRHAMVEQYEWADVMLLPSICEGSAGAVYEAMACGLPVICTPNTGSVVRDGLDGFVVPAGDSDAITDKLTRLHADRSLLLDMARSATDRATTYNMAGYSRRLVSEFSRAQPTSERSDGEITPSRVSTFPGFQ